MNNLAIRQAAMHTLFSRKSLRIPSRLATLASITLLMFSELALSQEISSFLFKDTINNGSGDINIFKPASNSRSISGPLLEDFRIDNNGSLVFAVDVNEASSGSETSTSQGVAVSSAILTLNLPTETLTYSAFYTPTRTLIAPMGTTNRTEHYTLIGTAGSNRVSPNVDSELTSSSIDETLYFDIDRDLTAVTSGSINIQFVETNIALGDPEEFYDYSNGFEEIALVTREDVLYLESLSPGRDAAPLVIDDTPNLSWVYYPSNSEYYVAAYEDLFPDAGDYDFNDAVVSYQVAMGLDANGDVSMIAGNGYMVSRGAEYNHDWYLRIALPESASATLKHTLFAPGSHTAMAGYPAVTSISGDLEHIMFPDIATIYADGASTYVNVYTDQAITNGPRFEFELTLDTPASASEIADAPFDPYLYVRDTNYEIHLVNQSNRLPSSRNSIDGLTSFKDTAGFPFAMLVPETWHPPLETNDMGIAYPPFMTFVNSSGTTATNWYDSPNNLNIKNLGNKNWKW